MSTVSSAIHNGIAEDYKDAKLYAKLRQEQPKGIYDITDCNKAQKQT